MSSCSGNRPPKLIEHFKHSMYNYNGIMIIGYSIILNECDQLVKAIKTSTMPSYNGKPQTSYRCFAIMADSRFN